MSEDKEDLDSFTVKVIEKNTSLQITLPPYFKSIYNLKKGDWIRLKFVVLHKKIDEETK